jgi:hypothetical protein
MFLREKLCERKNILVLAINFWKVQNLKSLKRTNKIGDKSSSWDDQIVLCLGDDILKLRSYGIDITMRGKCQRNL